MSDLIARFEDVDMEIIDHEGQRWVTVKALADALGYEDHRSLVNLINRKSEEFEGKTFVIKLMTNSPGRPDTTIINYHGVIRVAMLSDAPRAKQFRDWAEEVLFRVMTTGFYADMSLEPHWTDMLSPSEQLRLIELRASIWLKLADRPRSRALWLAHYETYGGRSRYGEYLRKVNGRIPQTNKEWRQFEREIERPTFSPEECFGQNQEDD